jgi:hypothetical protein
MIPRIRIIIIIFAITLVGVVRIAVNYSPLPVNANNVGLDQQVEWLLVLIV